jgi:hypothetical protein
MSSEVTFSYGDYIFDPKPLFRITSEPMKTPDGTGYGMMYNISVFGDLLLTTADERSSGIVGVFAKVEALKDALDGDGKFLQIECGGTAVIDGYPTIEDFAINNESDNYTSRASYTIEFKTPATVYTADNNVDPFNSSLFPPYIERAEESWDVEFQDERLPFDWDVEGTTEKFGYKVAVTHTVDVTARITYTGHQVFRTPWQDARDYAITRLGFDNESVNLTGILGLPGGGYFTQTDVYNHFRRVSTDETNGTISIVETFVVSPSGANSLPNNAIETFDISTTQRDGIVSVSIQGEIEGLSSISYVGDGGSNTDFIVTGTPYAAASGYFNTIKSRIYGRASQVYSGLADDCAYSRSLNPIARVRTIGTNVIDGIISYNYEYDTSTQGCITGDCILSQNISINDQLSNDLFASHIILGRATGPILQDLGTVSARVRTVNIELVTLPPTGCSTVSGMYEPIPTGAIQSFIDTISGDLIDNYDQVFISENNQNWNFTAGRYTKSVGFTYNTCS